MTMKFPAWISLLLVVTLLHQPSNLIIARADLIQQTCRKTRQLDLCIETLKSDRSSASADLKGLNRIMLEANLANSKDALAQVTKMFKQASSPDLKKCLEVCREEYDSAANEDFPTAIRGLGSGDLGTAKTYASAAFDAPGNCQDTFSERRGIQAPPDLANINDHFEKLASIALAMLNSLG